MTTPWIDANPWIYESPYSELAAFVHAPLQHEAGKDEIRLLRHVDATLADGLTEWNLEHFQINEELPSYCAISYTWGTDHDDRPILVNGALFWVRRGMHQFLTRFARSEYTTRYIWVDQICIAQRVVEERNHQVQIMSLIYGRASTVIVWLGLPEKSDEIALRILRDSTPYWRKTSTTKPQLRVANTAMTEFFRKPYWHRLWVIQELILARQRHVWCGEMNFSWNEIKQFCNLYRQDFVDGHRQSAQCDDLDIPRPLVHVTVDATPSLRVSFADAITAYALNECADTRDAVYGLQSIVIAEERLAIDYTKSVKEVYFDAVLHMARLGGDGLARMHFLAKRMGVHYNTYVDTECFFFSWTVGSREAMRSIAWLRYIIEDMLFRGEKAIFAWIAAKQDSDVGRLPPDFWIGLYYAYVIEAGGTDDEPDSQDWWLEWLETKLIYP